MLVLDKRRVVLTGNEPRDGVHRAGPVGRDNDREIFNRLRLQAHTNARHTGRLHLEHAGRSALREHLHDPGVVVSHARHGKIRLAHTDLLDGVVDDRDIAQAEEVHL